MTEFKKESLAAALAAAFGKMSKDYLCGECNLSPADAFTIFNMATEIARLAAQRTMDALNAVKH